jgi:hypothetical protein
VIEKGQCDSLNKFCVKIYTRIAQKSTLSLLNLFLCKKKFTCTNDMLLRNQTTQSPILFASALPHRFDVRLQSRRTNVPGTDALF